MRRIALVCASIACAVPAWAQSFDGRYTGGSPPITGRTDCPGFSNIAVQVAGNALSGTAILDRRGQQSRYTISGTVDAGGGVVVRLTTTASDIPAGMRTSVYMGRISGGTLDAQQPPGTCGRAMRLGRSS